MKRMVWVCLCIALLLAVQITGACASYNWYGYGVATGFRNAAFETTGRVGDDDGHAAAANLWVGTIEEPTLGKAYLVAESPMAGLLIWGDAGYRSYTGELPLQPSPACTLPAGSWTVQFRAGVPYLYRDGVYVQDTTATITRGNFSIPVRDQFGNPVVGARFVIHGVTWGGNDDAEYGQVVTDAAGMLTFPMGVQADLSYWFEQVSAPTGYLPMEEAYYDVNIGERGGFLAVPASVATQLFQYADVVINKTADGRPITAQSPASQANPPATGDHDQPMLWMLLMLVSAGLLVVLMRAGKTQVGRRNA